MTIVDQRPQWPKYVALVALVVLGSAIGFGCSGGPTMLDRGFSIRVAVATAFGAIVGFTLFGIVVRAGERKRDR
jgi:hypothetical protein